MTARLDVSAEQLRPVLSLASLQAEIEELRAELGLLRAALKTDRVSLAVATERQLARPGMEPIIERVCAYFGFRREVVFSKTREEPVVWARHVCWYLLKEQLSLNNCDMARLIGVDNGTIHHGVSKVRKRLETKDRKALAHLSELRNAQTIFPADGRDGIGKEAA